MVHRRRNNAASKVAQINLKTKECAKGMVQKSNYAVVKDARAKPRKEDFA